MNFSKNDKILNFFFIVGLCLLSVLVVVAFFVAFNPKVQKAEGEPKVQVLDEEPKSQEIAEEVKSAENAPETQKSQSEPEAQKVVHFDCALSDDLQEYMCQMCEQYNVEPALMISVMEKESKFHANEISATNDYGLMQINACHKAWLKSSYGITNLLDPKQNIQAGAIMLGNLAKYGSLEKIAMAYNLGEGGAQSMFRRGVYSTAYSREVARIYQKYTAQV